MTDSSRVNVRDGGTTGPRERTIHALDDEDLVGGAQAADGLHRALHEQHVADAEPHPAQAVPQMLPTSLHREDAGAMVRFQVQVRFDVSQKEELITQLRIGGQASVTAYTEEASVTRTLARIYIRAMSILSYAY